MKEQNTNDERDPQILYRYRSLSAANKQFVERIFLKNEIYFPSPSAFNDPFDCKISLSMQARDQRWKKYFSQLLKTNDRDLNRHARRAKACDAVRHGRHQQFAKHFDFFSAIVEPLGVFCLSEEPDQILMWSHYADSHKGIVIGFKADRYTPFFGPAQPVTYSDSYPKLNFLHDLPEITMSILTTKSHHWSYEKEWRIIDYEKGHGYFEFPHELMVSVILGCNISSEDKNLVLSWCTQRKQALQIYQAVKKENEFSLKLEEIKWKAT